MTPTVIAVCTIMVLFWLAMIWAFVCNERTLKQRLDIINSLDIISNDQRTLFWQHYDSVEYNAHFWRLMTFRDPYKLYPAFIRVAVNTHKMLGRKGAL